MQSRMEPKLVVTSNKNRRSAAKVCEYMTYAAKEAFKRLRTNTLIALEDEKEKKCRIIGITSGQPSEGKSTVAINLAFSIAELGKSVLLIDGDMYRPSVHTSMGIALSSGLSEVLTGSENLKDVILRYESSADDTHFDLILRGATPDKPSELLYSNRFQKLIDVVSMVYDYIIIDLPPVNAVVDAVSVSKCTDGLIVVVRENHCPRGVLTSCVEQLKYAKANILGFVMNGCVGGSGKKYQYGGQYGYYHYGSK